MYLPYTAGQGPNFPGAPDASSDKSLGFGPGYEWNDTTTGRTYVCTDSSPGAAVWLSTTATAARPTKPQIVSYRGIVPYNKWGNGVNSRSDTRLEARIRLKIGPYDVSGIELAFSNFVAAGNAAAEAATGNDITVEAALELVSPVVTHQLTFAGNSTSLISNGAPLKRTDPLNIGLAAGSTPWARYSTSVTAGTLSYPAGNHATQAAIDSGSLNSNGSSQVAATGAMASAGGLGGIYGAPAAILGVPVQRHPSVCILGDSIGQGLNDVVDANSNKGFIQRGLYSVNWNGMTGVSIPNMLQSVGGDTLSMNQDDLIRKRAFWPYATDVIVELLTNDIVAGATLAQLQTRLTTIWTAIKRTTGPYGAPVRVTQTLPLPRTNVANTVPSTGFASGGVRDQVIAWIKAQKAAGVIDFIIDPTPYVEDPAAHGFWLASQVPTDGTHPTTAGHIAMSAAVTAWAAALTV